MKYKMYNKMKLLKPNMAWFWHPFTVDGYWERRCDAILLSKGWANTPEWRSCY